jgi:hypothetical protein
MQQQPPINRVLRQYARVLDHAASWRRSRRGANRPLAACRAARTTAASHVQFRSRRGCRGLDLLRSDRKEWLTLKLETRQARIFRFEVSFSNPVSPGCEGCP